MKTAAANHSTAKSLITSLETELKGSLQTTQREGEEERRALKQEIDGHADTLTKDLGALRKSHTAALARHDEWRDTHERYVSAIDQQVAKHDNKISNREGGIEKILEEHRTQLTGMQGLGEKLAARTSELEITARDAEDHRDELQASYLQLGAASLETARRADNASALQSDAIRAAEKARGS
jgi:hypothetical protein